MGSTGASRDSRRRTETDALVRRYHELTVGDRDDAADVLTEDVMLHEVWEGEHRRGREAVVEGWREIQRAFPDWSVEVHDVVAGEGMAASRWTNTFTFEREFEGIAPTGETITLSGLTMYRLEDGRVAEIWDNADTHQLRQQLGMDDD